MVGFVDCHLRWHALHPIFVHRELYLSMMYVFTFFLKVNKFTPSALLISSSGAVDRYSVNSNRGDSL